MKTFDEEFEDATWAGVKKIDVDVVNKKQLKSYIHSLLDSLKVEEFDPEEEGQYMVGDDARAYNTCAKEVNQKIEELKKLV